MNIQRITALLNAPKVSIPEVSAKSGVSIRTLYRIKAGYKQVTLETFASLQEWAKGRRLPTDAQPTGQQ